MPKRCTASSDWPTTKCRSCCCPSGRRVRETGRRSRAVRSAMCWIWCNISQISYLRRDYDGKNRGSKAEQVPADFEADSRYVHQEHRVHPKYDGDLRAEPDRVQLMGHPARLLEQGARREDA